MGGSKGSGQSDTKRELLNAMKSLRYLYLLLLIFASVSCTSTVTNHTGSISATQTAYNSSPTVEITSLSIPGEKTPIIQPSPSVISTSTPIQKVNTSNATPIAPGKYSFYMGIKVPPLPEGLAIEGSTLISDGDYGLDLVKADDNTFMIWFTKLYGPTQQVLDVLVLPDLKKDEVITTNYCRINGQEDAEVITIGLLDREAYKTRFLTSEKIQKAWRANRNLEVFEIIQPLGGIECPADGGFDPNRVIGQYSR